jgi:microcin C transport system substrate-binding protein
MRIFLFLICWLAVLPAYAQDAKPVHAMAMHGDLKYSPDFVHFDYVNPDAPKGGTMKLSGAETFDSFNGFITKGVSASGLGLLYVPLMEKSQDEAFSMYGALAESTEVPEDRSWAIFNLRKEAVWHDGKPITAEDVVWTFNTLVEKGQPAYRAYYAHIEKAEALSERRVKFTFDMANNLELPLIIGELTVLPKHYWEGRDFEKTTLEPPLGSGPYKISSFDQGRSVTYERVKDWWGADLPVYKGRYNFDRIVYEYYRDQDVSLQAFFGNEFDFRLEYTAKLWATGYNIPAVKDGRIIKATIENKLPQGMQGFAMNMRRPIWQDKNVRKAMNLAFDFEWSNKQFAYDAYTRTRSYFSNSEMEATGVPQGRELEILEAYRDQLPPEVFTQEFNPPQTDGAGNNRANLREAMQLLDEAGYVMGEDGVRVHKDTGVRLEFEFLVANTNVAFERWFGPYKKNLERIGMKGDMRVVDASQYINRVLDFDFDLVVQSWGQSTSPGNEQREYWGSERADIKGSRNFIGIKDPVVDDLISQVIAAPTREELVIRTRALDRVLQNSWYVVPNWHIPAWRVAYWDKFERPAIQADYSLGEIDTWWAK